MSWRNRLFAYQNLNKRRKKKERKRKEKKKERETETAKRFNFTRYSPGKCNSEAS